MSGQHLRERATFLTSEGNKALLLASSRDQTVAKGGKIMMRLCSFRVLGEFFKLCFFHDEESYITNDLMTNPSGKS